MIATLGRQTGKIVAVTGGMAALVLTSCTVTSTPGTGGPNLPGVAAAAVRLVSFDSCDQALSELQAAAEPHVSPYGIAPGWDAIDVDIAVDGEVMEEAAGEDTGAPADAPAAAADERAAAAQADGSDYSTTNVHEAGVDEPDLVKTDGRRLISLQNQTLRVVDLERRVVTGTLELPGSGEQMLLAGDRLLVIGYHWSEQPMPTDTAELTMPMFEGVDLVLVDVSGAPRELERLTVDGGFTDARMVGSTAHVVLNSWPRLPTVYPDFGRGEDEAREANLEVLRESTIDDWLPRYVHRSGGAERTGRLVDCADVSHPEQYSGTAMLNVVTVDVTAGLEPVGSVSVVGDGHTVYATGESLYVADGGQWWFRGDGDARTAVHKFDIGSAGKPAYVGSGEIQGWLLNQYAMSEYDGHLRVATTMQDLRRTMAPDEQPVSESQVVVLAERDGRLDQVGQVGGLGKGERIYAVRFIGPIGYVVTFREIDPLYTVDLSDPTNPRVRGELKIPGYSAYLHPVGEGRLLGVGQDATEDGRQLGAQVSLFDVSDLDDPQRIATFGLDGAATEVEYDPHAFLYWPRDELVVLPVRTMFWGEPMPLPRPGPADDIAPWHPPQGGALALRMAGDGFTELGTIEHPAREIDSNDPYYFEDASIRRSLVVGETLWTVSAGGVMGHGTRDLEKQAWIPFD